jgi:membrane associated rhomboid family serine protease
MSTDLRVVFESRSRRACKDRALVLASARIPYQVIEDAGSCALVVPAEHSPRAAAELRLYDEENPPRQPKKPIHFEHQNGVPGVIGYLVVIGFVGWLAGESAFARDWLAAGRIDGALLRAGEWWRSVTALTLHSGLRHLAGNVVFGTFFGLFAGRMLGPGVAWLVILLAGAAGNTLNTLLLESSHRSIGASTAVFAALGLLAGFVWRGKLMSQERWNRGRPCVAHVHRHRRREHGYRRPPDGLRLRIWQRLVAGPRPGSTQRCPAAARHRRSRNRPDRSGLGQCTDDLRRPGVM